MIRPPPRSTLFPYTTLSRSFLVKLDRIFLPPLDNQCTKQSRLLLKPAVAVIPVGTALHHRDAVEERLAGRNAGKAQPGNSVQDRKSTRLNSSHVRISYAVFC